MSGLPTRRVGRTAIEITTLGFGAASIGNLYREVPETQGREAVDAAWDEGVRYFDTAPHYGLGLSERRLGAALADRPRGAFVLSTKVGRLLVPNETPTGTDLAHQFAVADDLRRHQDYTAAGVRRSLEESLQRLGLDRVDIAFVHDPDDHVEQALAGALPELVRMREEGILGAIGVGMNQWEIPLRLVRESDLDLVMLAGRWTLLDRSGLPLLQACAERGVAVLAAAPFNSGLLARPEPSTQSHFDYGSPAARLIEAARRLAVLAREFDATLPQVAIHFPLRHPAVAAVVNGLAKPDHVRTSCDWLRSPVPEAFWAEADRLVEGLA